MLKTIINVYHSGDTIITFTKYYIRLQSSEDTILLKLKFSHLVVVHNIRTAKDVNMQTRYNHYILKLILLCCFIRVFFFKFYDTMLYIWNHTSIEETFRNKYHTPYIPNPLFVHQ